MPNGRIVSTNFRKQCSVCQQVESFQKWLQCCFVMFCRYFKMELRSLGYIAVGFSSLAVTLLTSFKFCYFLSSNQSGLLVESISKHGLNSNEIALALLLVIFFVVVHSLFATEWCKRLFDFLSVTAIHRSIYNLISSIALQVLMRYWAISNLPLVWNYGHNYFVITLCQIVHVIGWLSIFSTIYILDFHEFIGLKQVQFYLNDMGCPLSVKTTGAQNFFNNMRHPVAFGVLVVLWIVPCMSVDRLLLASGFSLYLFHGSKLNKENYEYVSEMYTKKSHSLDDSKHE